MTNRSKVSSLVLAIVTALYLIVYLIMDTNAVTKKAKLIVEYDQSVMQQYLWFHPSERLNEDQFNLLLKSGDPNRIAIYIFRDLYDRRDLPSAELMINAVIREWDLYKTHKLNYKFAYGKLDAGWWSGMEGFMFPMLLVAFSQLANSDGYIDLANRMIDEMLKTPERGGVLWKAGGCWLSEYSWDNMQQAEEYYVLNGNLFALEAIKLLAEALNRNDLRQTYECVLDGTKARSDKFLKEGAPWSLYMLHPPTINQVHYVIFETMQFDNLYELTRDKYYKYQAELRREILRKRYPIFLIDEARGKKRIFFSLMGAPHPYTLDTYGIHIICENQEGGKQVYKQYDQFDESKSMLDRIFIDSSIDFKDGMMCSVYARSVGLEFLLYRTTEFIRLDHQNRPERLSYEVNASLDGYMVDTHRLIVDPARVSSKNEEYLNTQARINYTFGSRLLTDDAFLGLELTPDQDLAIGIQLRNGSTSIFRYYPKLNGKKKNLVLLSKLGFDGGREINKIDGATVFIYTHNQSYRAVIDVGNMLLFKNQSGLLPYFRESDVYMHTE